jgi:hypothetical protein
MSTKQNDKAQTNPLTKLLPLPLFMLSLAACVDAPAPRRGQSGNLTTQSLMDPTRASAKVSAATKRFEGLKGDVPVFTGMDCKSFPISPNPLQTIELRPKKPSNGCEEMLLHAVRLPQTQQLKP